MPEQRNIAARPDNEICSLYRAVCRLRAVQVLAGTSRTFDRLVKRPLVSHFPRTAPETVLVGRLSGDDVKLRIYYSVLFGRT